MLYYTIRSVDPWLDMKFEELKKFIKEDMKMAPRKEGGYYNYQPIMILTLIQSKNGEATKKEILEEIYSLTGADLLAVYSRFGLVCPQP